jgi:hypothetical protein
VKLERSADAVEVVDRDDDRRGGDLCGDAGAAGHGQGGQAGPGVDQEAVGVAVVAARELHDEVAPCRAPCEPECAHGRFRARRREAELLHRWNGRPDRLAEDHLGGRRRTEGEAVAGSGSHGIDDHRMSVTEDRRSPCADVVDVPVAVGIANAGAVASLEHKRRPADGSERTDRAVDAAREEVLGASDQVILPGPCARVGDGRHRLVSSFSQPARSAAA